MSDASIKLISSVRPIDSNIISGAQLPVQVETAATPKQKEKSQVPQAVESASDQSNSLSNVSLQFRVDDKTNDVTIFIVDRQSKKVLRSIPAGELQKLQVGDLLKLTI
jgi:uncharacterized FlaG/YvyC family protein